MGAFLVCGETADPSAASGDPQRVRDLALNCFPSFHPSSSAHPHEEPSLMRTAIMETEAVIQQRKPWQLGG